MSLSSAAAAADAVTSAGAKLSPAAQHLRIEQVRILFCTFGGSSGGIRSFLSSELFSYARQHPDVKFSVERRARRHPLAIGRYRNGYERTLELSNQSPREIRERLDYLINSLGNKQRPPTQLSYGVVSQSPSIQGMTRVAQLTPDWYVQVARKALDGARSRAGIPSFAEIVDHVGMTRATRIFQRVQLLARTQNGRIANDASSDTA
jgi:large subunit ribosomal protein L43